MNVERANVSQVHPFGEADCESEVAILKDEYSQYYFYHTRFNELALERGVFLIIGRRGSGKTALSQYFSFQKQIRNATAIDVDEPDAFQMVLNRISSSAAHSREVAIPRIAKIWEFVIWSIIFRELQDEDLRIKAACIFGDEAGKVSMFIKHLLKALITRFVKTEGELADEFENLVGDSRIVEGKTAVLELAKKRPIIVSFDTLENYPLEDDAMMRSTAALIQFASEFNRSYAHQNIHIKLFIMAEVFPRLKEGIILNPLKVVRDEIYLHWRPKSLLRLLSWRFYRYLSYNHYSLPMGDIDWEDHQDVQEKMWDAFFGKDIVNSRGLSEKTFPYVLRHSQLRPRQLILICNRIAKFSQKTGGFPHFSQGDMINGIHDIESDLSDEVFNSYSSIYPKVGQIAEALYGLPVLFKGKELDKRAPQTASAWPKGEYSPLNFRQLVAELGIVGRVRRVNEKAGFVEADFEYTTDSRLPLLVEDDCVCHPMFFRKLNISVDRNVRVYPFPDHPDFRDLDYSSF